MPGSSGLPLAGVEAIIEGLTKFEHDTERMNKALEGIRPRTTLLQRGFASLTEGIIGFGKGLISWGVEGVTAFGKSIIHIAEIAIGVLLRDAINAAIGWIRDFVKSTIEAGSELQLLQLRLNRLNFNELKKSGEEYNDITAKSIEMTKEQLNWVIRLAAQTPYDNADIANVYTLARSYGFAAEEAKFLTQDIVDFASGMGLTEEHIKRIIINFGQMKQQGKITGTEMRDLARGSFVPVNDILERVAESLGLTTEELDKLRKKGKTDAEDFFLAFAQMVDEDFEGAAQDMRRALVPAIENIQETFRSLMSWNLVVPVMDLLGGKISDITDAIVNNEVMWNRLTKATERIGTAIVGVLTDLLGLAPSAESIADTLVGGVERMAVWIEEHRDDIVGFFNNQFLPAIKGVANFITQTAIPAIGKIFTTIKESAQEFQKSGFSADFLEKLGFKPETAEKIIGFVDGIRDALIRVFGWLDENGPLIKEFFTTLAEIGGTVFKNIMEWLGQKVEGDSILDAITAFMKLVIDNKDKIAEWVEILAKAVIIWQVLATVWNIAMSVIIPLIGFVLGLWAVFASLNAVVAFLAPLVMGLLPWLVAIGGVVLLLSMYWDLFKKTLIAVQAGLEGFVGGFKYGFEQMRQAAIVNILAIKNAILNGDWFGVGMAIINGLAQGILMWMGTLAIAITTALMNMVEAAKNYLGVHSPSTLFTEIGQSLMDGLAQGITNGVNAVTGGIDHITSVVNEKINHLISVAEEKMNHLSSLLGGSSIDFSGLGIGVSTAWAYGINQNIEAGVTAGRNMAEQTTRAARRALSARSPSKVFEDLGMFTVQGFAQGIEKAAGLAVGAMQNVMSATMVPAISSVMAARSGGDTITNERNYNLTVHSSAPTEPILQDFQMLQSLTGA